MSVYEVTEAMLKFALDNSESLNNSKGIYDWYNMHLLDRSTVERIGEALPGVYALYEKHMEHWKCYYINRTASLRKDLLSLISGDKICPVSMSKKLSKTSAFTFCVVFGDDVREIMVKYIYDQIKPECNNPSEFALVLPIPLPPYTMPNGDQSTNSETSQPKREVNHSTIASTGSTENEEYQNAFRFCGNGWEVVYDGKTTIEKNLIGMKYIQVLLKNPNIPISIHELSGIVADPSCQSLREMHDYSDGTIEQEGLSTYVKFEADEIYDKRSRDKIAYEIQRLEKLKEEAVHLGNMSKAEKYDDEIEKIEKIFSKATGLCGKPRRMNNNEERERKRVFAAISYSKKAIRKSNESLYEHLNVSIRTGGEVIYLPRAEIVWKTD